MAGSPSLAVGRTGVPFIAFQTLGKTTVMSFTGTNWDPIGSPGFANSYVISLALHPRLDLPYLAFSGTNDNLKTTLMAYNGTGWAKVGASSFSAMNVQIVSLQLDPSGVPYVACQDYAVVAGQGLQRAVVWVYKGTWAPVGGNSSGFSAGTASFISLALHPSTALPYVAFRDESVSGQATVMMHTGTSWVVIGKPGISAGQASYISLALHPVTGAPVVAYRDAIVNGAVVYTANSTGWWTQLGAGGSGQWMMPELSHEHSWIGGVVFKLTCRAITPLFTCRQHSIWSYLCQSDTASNHWDSLCCVLQRLFQCVFF